MVSDDRGQIFTLEAFVASLLVISAVGFALSVTAATPLSESASNQHLETELAAHGSGLLGSATATEVLGPTLRYWDDSTGSFHGAGEKGYYVTCSFDTAFGDLLERTLSDNGIACTVNLQYLTTTHDLRREQLVYVGEPTDHAVRASTTVTLYDDDVLLDASGNATSTTLAEASTFYAPDAAPDDRLYNVVRVEVVLWRM